MLLLYNGKNWDTEELIIIEDHGKKVGFPGGSVSKESVCKAGNLGSIIGLGRSLEKGKATHSSFLAWRIPTDRGACGPQFMGSQRVGHD